MPMTVSICRPASPSLPRRRPTCTSTERVFDLAIEPPHALEQSVAREHAVPVLDEKSQQLEFALGQPDGHAGHAYRHGVEIDRQQAAPVTGALLRCSLRWAPQYRAYAGDELSQAERLRDVVVSPKLEPRDTVRFAGPCRHHDDRNGRARRPSAQQAAHLEAVDESRFKSSRTSPGDPP